MRRVRDINAFGVRDRILVMGSGPAGLSAAQELRRLGFRGELTVAGDDPDGAYDRTACSKGLLTGHQRPSDAKLPVDPALDITWRLGRRAVGLDLDRRAVEAHTGELLRFDGLVIATGSRPVLPAGWPTGEPGLHVLHSLADAWDLRRDLRHARRVAIVGGGLTGCEVACAVLDLAREAVVIESRAYLMSRALGEPIGRLVTYAHSRAGTSLRLGRRVSMVDRWRGGWRLDLDDGSVVDADVVVVTTGERPDVSWLDGYDLDLTDGVGCDAALRVDGLPGAVAAGALARWPNPRYGVPARCGQWIAALEQGPAAARSLLAGDRVAPPVSILPRYWSFQLGLRIEVCGELDGDPHVEGLRTDRRQPERGGALATYWRDGWIVGAAAVNAPRAFTAVARDLIRDEPVLEVLPARRSPTRRRHLTAV